MIPDTDPTRVESQRSLPLISIAVMGATGSGKSSFINIASDSQLRVGKGLESCTAEIQLSDEFIVDGRRVILIDTPGLDDTNTSDAEILNRIAAFLVTTYESGSKLSGIIYLQRICDDRFTGISVRNFKMFRHLCGDSTLKNVALVTNMWGKVAQDVGDARELELSNKFFKPALDKDAQLTRHHDTTQSSHDIIRGIMKNDPAAFQIQRELVDEGKKIKDTAAGEVVSEEINKLIKCHEGEVEALREELRHALENRDGETRAEVEEATGELKEQIRRLKAESETMAAKYEEEKRKAMKRNLSEGGGGLFRTLVWAMLPWRIVPAALRTIAQCWRKAGQVFLRAIAQRWQKIVQSVLRAMAQLQRQQRVAQTAPRSLT